eukprot:CAMPEP_0196758268 /NCGR_PEP_ID=MMETSP1091-20130531/104098_1 /TAXON_ID=302021 /ORGANISM="Rhodomonas sp., Strain CCMP768" /LENGTH=76 /DNA_ID=CAMNT_0042107079 /DNA_START=569 /DNA_END=799 /DNA_ORIENTATION=+
MRWTAPADTLAATAGGIRPSNPRRQVCECSGEGGGSTTTTAAPRGTGPAAIPRGCQSQWTAQTRIGSHVITRERDT